MRPQEFRAKWSTPSGNERQTYQEHFRDLCAFLHQPAPSAANRAVWSAYGWEDDPTETTEDELLTRLLALNLSRQS